MREMASTAELMTSPTTTASSRPFSSFKRLSTAVQLHEPTQFSDPRSGNEPTTILICSWLNASSKHIQYYTKWYMQRFPNARIIVTTIRTKQFLIESETKRRQDIKPAVDAILARPEDEERLLVHTLSNGGAKRLYGVAGVYRTVTGKPLPTEAIIFDSAPGIPQFRRDIYALQLEAKKFSWFVWLPYMLAVYLISIVVYVCVHRLPKWVWRELVWGKSISSGYTATHSVFLEQFEETTLTSRSTQVPPKDFLELSCWISVP